MRVYGASCVPLARAVSRSNLPPANGFDMRTPARAGTGDDIRCAVTVDVTGCNADAADETGLGRRRKRDDDGDGKGKFRC